MLNPRVRIRLNFRDNNDSCKLGKKYLNYPLCKSGAYSLKHLETFDLSHAFLTLIVAKLSTLKQIRFFGLPCTLSWQWNELWECVETDSQRISLFLWLQIDTYESIYQDVETVEGSIIFEKWFRVDARPFRQALLNIVKKWSFMFKQHLIDHVTNRPVLNDSAT